MPELFHRLPRNVITIFSGRNLWYHLLAIVLTVLIVMIGSDWEYYRLTRNEVFAELAHGPFSPRVPPPANGKFMTGKRVTLCAA